MKKYITLFHILNLIILSEFASAQPEITQNNLPQVGDVTIIAICSDAVNPGNSGEMQTWDMSSLTETEEQSFTYIPVSEGLRNDSFPNATLCAVNWKNDYSYYSVSPSALSIEGHVVTTPLNDTSEIVFIEIEQVVTLPYSYNDSFLNNFDGNTYIDGLGTFPFEGFLDFEADGYGTLILPIGTFENVVRYHVSREQTNFFNGIPAGTQTKDQWVWVSEDYRFWLLLMEESFDGFNTTQIVWFDKNPQPAITTGINILNANAITIYPNPIKVNHKINIKWDKKELVKLTLFKLDGSLVLEDRMKLDVGSNSYNFKSLVAGLYILKIEAADGYFTKKISVID